MITAVVILLVVEALSLLLLFINIQIFRSQSEKYSLLLADLGNQGAWGKPGRLIIPFYVACTLIAAAMTTVIFIFQPHLL